MTSPVLPEVAARAQTAASILAAQRPSGEIPWESTGHTDVWDHTEAVLALLVTDQVEAGERGLRWLAATQRPDGSWPLRTRDGAVEDAGTDLNHTAYAAVGLLCHHLTTGSVSLAHELWPTVSSALDLVVSHQLSWGGFPWAVGAGGPCAESLITSTSSIHHALRCGLALAALVGEEGLGWEHAAFGAREALRRNDARFTDKKRYSMDWYYPVLGGAVRGAEAEARIDARWDEFVVPGLGIRCVDDHPWVTGAETCELAMALALLGRREEAINLVADMQHLRDPDGSYNTGYVYTDDARWPVEASTWTAGAMLLACDVIERADGVVARLFSV